MANCIVHFDGLRVAEADNSADALAWVAEQQTPEAYTVYEYLGGSPSNPDSWKEVPVKQDFDAALASFVAGCQAKCTANDAKFENVNFNTKISIERGRRYVRVVRSDDHGGRSVHCFVDMTNGNVLKAAGWKAPAKHARGNIFADDNGLGCMGEYGAAYLR